MAILPPPKKIGTGFTNINRVLNVNKGNQLGNVVSSGVQNQAQGVKTQTLQSRDKFNQEAQKNRLDTEENTQKRDNVIGRFNQPSGNSAVGGTQQVADQVGQASNENINANARQEARDFKVSSDVQDKYKAENDRLQGLLATNQSREVVKPENFDQTTYDKLNRWSQIGINDLDDANEYIKLVGLTGSTVSAQQILEDSQRAQRQSNSGYNPAGVMGGFNPGPGFIAMMKANQMKTDYDKAAPAREAEYKRLLTEKLEDVSGVEKKLFDNDKALNTATAAERNAFLASQVYDPTEQDIQDFTKFRTGGYTGPKSLEDYQTLLGNASEAEQLGDLSRSSGGRQELLRRFVGGEGYNQGQQKLDNLLLGQSGQGINDVRKNTRGLEKLVVESNNNSMNTAKELQNRAKLFNESTVEKLNAARNPYDEQINTQLAGIQANEAKRGDFLNQFNQDIMGKSDETKRLSEQTRLEQVLQASKDGGYLPQHIRTQLESTGGLLERSKAAGLNTNELLSSRMRNVEGQNINRGGAADGFQEQSINSLDRLLGRQAEFETPGADYEAGSIDYDVNSLAEYLKKVEGR